MTGPRKRRRSIGAGLLPAGLLAVALVLGPVRPAGAAGQAVGFDMSIEGHLVSAASAGAPLRLREDEDAVAWVSVTNPTAQRIVVQTVRLDGRVAGLVFFGYLARVDLVVEPGATARRDFRFDLGGLGAQATGQVPGRVQLLRPDGGVIAEHTFHVDVHGSATSTYGAFGIVVALITAVLIVAGVVRLLAGTLSENRWSRGVRFAVCGIGIGMTIAYAASAFRVLTPTTGTGVSLVVFCAVVGLAFGYLSPTPGRSRPGDDDELDDPLADGTAPATAPA